MSTRIFNALLLCLLIISPVYLSAKKSYAVWMADSEMKRNPKSWILDFQQKLMWDYCNELELQSILQVWKRTGDIKYFDYTTVMLTPLFKKMEV